MNEPRTYSSVSNAGDVLAQGFMTKVYAWMMLGLIITGGAAYVTSTSETLLSALIGRWTFIILAIAEVGIVIYLSSRIMTMNPTTASVMFFVYALLNGLTLTPIMLIYTRESISTAFFTTAAMFGAMSVYGTVTKRDLSSWGSFLMMGLVGLLVALLINMFVGSSRAELVISIMGVIIFTGLTAYDTNRIRAMAREMRAGDDVRSNMAVMGALKLYLDFINMFLFLLRIFGKRR
ncbi:MAG: Bax inhibitor-1/YccA family protein [Synergistaceae bacterium]|jgi:FtsH-binding integral membrane protein|nr:Bax inhibitor-1/YccA family protein [Synergistaceae bacterium]